MLDVMHVFVVERKAVMNLAIGRHCIGFVILISLLVRIQLRSATYISDVNTTN